MASALLAVVSVRKKLPVEEALVVTERAGDNIFVNMVQKHTEFKVDFAVNRYKDYARKMSSNLKHVQL